MVGMVTSRFIYTYQPFVTNMNDAEKENKTNNSEIIEGNIDTLS
ncbi:hypothetical protein GCM10009865_43490 [Aeromicrobium ponti]